MNIYRYSAWLFTGILLCTILMQACFKKGEDDPFISLKSRNARLKGNWNLVKYSISGEDMLNDEDKYSNYSYYCGNYTNIIKNNVVIQFDFDKSGEVKIDLNLKQTVIYDYSNTSCTDYNKTENDTGAMAWKWAFLSENNGKKNKEQIVLINESGNYYSYNNTYYNYYTNNYNSGYTFGPILSMVYNITRLSNKEMRWEATIDGELVEMEFQKK